VGAPAPRGVLRRQCAGVSPPRRDRAEGMTAGHAGWRRPVCGCTMADLAMAALTPAQCGTALGDGARVREAGGELGEACRAGDLHRRRAFGSITRAELTAGVEAPAECHAGRVERTRVRDAGREAHERRGGGYTNQPVLSRCPAGPELSLLAGAPAANRSR